MKYKILSATKFLSFFELESGWAMVSRNTLPKFVTGNLLDPDAVHIICTTTKKGKPHLVVTKEYRMPLQSYEIGVPAGLIDKGETTLEAAARELFEETGLKLSNVLDISLVQSNSSGTSDESFVTVYCEVIGELSKDNLEKDEDIETMILNVEEVNDILTNNQEFLICSKLEIIMKLFVKTECIHPNQL